MKILGVVFIFLGLLTTGIWVGNSIYSNYQWNNEVLSYWSLSDKTSTLEAKSGFMDKFISALKTGNLADNDALIYKTADNNCANNVQAVETLKQRLDEIKGMDVTSFQYQQAIQQITSQEQGDADNLILTLRGCWYKTHHYYLWNNILTLVYGAAIVMLFLVGVTVLTI